MKICIKYPLLLLMFLNSVSAKSETFIGKITPPTPIGCESVGASIISTEYKFAYEQLVCGTENIFLLAEQYEKHEKGIRWKIIDELKLPPFKNGVKVLYPLCQSKKYPGTLLVIGEWGETKADGTFSAKTVNSAWLFNTDRRKIESVPTSDIICEGENAD